MKTESQVEKIQGKSIVAKDNNRLSSINKTFSVPNKFN